MAACEKCWGDAYDYGHGDQSARYNELIAERLDNPCTPEQQCGEMHLVLKWKDGGMRCRCGKVVECESQR